MCGKQRTWHVQLIIFLVLNFVLNEFENLIWCYIFHLQQESSPCCRWRRHVATAFVGFVLKLLKKTAKVEHYGARCATNLSIIFVRTVSQSICWLLCKGNVNGAMRSSRSTWQKNMCKSAKSSSRMPTLSIGV